jgi:predicted component of type VI protein secretion system
MESERKPSIFSDRGFIGSAGELDEYGVWVKSEPEDIAFDNSAFFDEIDNEIKAKGGADSFGFVSDLAAVQHDADESADLAYTGQSNSANKFESDAFGMEEPEEQRADVYTEGNEAAAPAEGTVGDSFDVDFGMEEPEEQRADVYTEENEAAASAEDTVGDSFDVDFGMEEPEEQRADVHTEGNEAAAPAEDTVGDSFDMDFGMEEPEEQQADVYTE